MLFAAVLFYLTTNQLIIYCAILYGHQERCWGSEKKNVFFLLAVYSNNEKMHTKN